MSKLEILQNKIDSVIERNRNINANALSNISREVTGISDYLVHNQQLIPYIDDTKQLVIKLPNDQFYSLTKNALNQLANKLKVPITYLNYLLTTDWGKTLVTTVLNSHFSNSNSRNLLRCYDNKIKGFLSDSYKRLDSYSIYENFLNNIKETGLKVYNVNFSETQHYIDAIFPQVYEINTPNNGQVHLVYGVHIGNSDYGDAALSIRSFNMQCVCLNGMIRNTYMRGIHLGSKLEGDFQVSNKTLELDTATKNSLVNDVLKQILSPEFIELEKNRMIESSNINLDFKKTFVELPKLGVLKEEINELERVFLQNKEDDGVYGGATLFKLTQGISAISRDKEPARQRDLQTISGKLLDKYLTI